jgi:hypothetical protein
MEKYKRGFIDEVRWYDANDDTKWYILTGDPRNRDNTFPLSFLYTYNDLIIILYLSMI